MNKNLIFSFIFIALILVGCTTNQNEQNKPDEWELVWVEEFEDSEIDWSTWSKTPRQGSNWNDAMSDADELYDIKDGKLILRGIKNTDHPNDTSLYLTGGIWTKGKQSFPVGRIDVSAKFNSAQGFWPAVWLMPVKDESTPDYYSELDILEHLNFDDFVYQTLHSNYTLEVNKTDPSNHVTVDVNVNEYNTYSVEVRSDSVVFLTNNQITYTYPRIDSLGASQFPFHKFEYYLILSAQLGGDWVGDVNIDQLPVEMSIDWIKVYKKK